ncbi:MAG: histidine phosphatase family protein [Lachnospiraceae bacterium]|nr:histidine phosphatase family protein [Lachnospiraceae bacterium]
MVGSWTDWELTELGVRHAKSIGEMLKSELAGKEFVMYSSDLLRAKQTAENVGNCLRLTPVLRSELRERNLGKCCGKSVQWLRENMEQPERTIDDRLFSDAGIEIHEPDSLEDYSGQFKLRIPRSLHRSLAEHSKREGISMNQYCVYLLSKNDAVYSK